MSEWNGSYNAPFASPYVSHPPPPAPMPSQYDQYAPSPNIQYAEPGSPIVYPVSPVGSPPRSRDSSRTRRNTMGGEPYIGIPDDRGRERMYHASHLIVGPSSQALSRSGSERSRPRQPVSYVEVAKSGSNRGRHGRSPSASYYYDGRDGGKKYTHNAAGSTYSNSSYGSRSHSKVRHSRSPSCDSCGSWDDHEHSSQAVGLYRPKKTVDEEKEELAAKLRKMELELQKVNIDIEKRKEEEEKARKEQENARLDRLRVEEIERKVSEKLMLQKKKEMEAAAEKAAKEAAEKLRIKEEAEKILKERADAEETKRKAEEAEKAKIQAIIDAERMKYEALSKGRRTYTKFSKVHLCKEALDERNISYTEEAEHFLVHRAVDKTEQNYLWNRTKEIRNYYRQIQEAADKAPTVRAADGSYVKYVQIAGQPYPIALPVTFTQTPGGGQTQRVDPIKIKWSDIFKPSKF